MQQSRRHLKKTANDLRAGGSESPEMLIDHWIGNRFQKSRQESTCSVDLSIGTAAASTTRGAHDAARENLGFRFWKNARERKMIQNMRWKQLAVREFIASSERPDWWQLTVTDGSLTGPAPKHAECRLQPRIRP